MLYGLELLYRKETKMKDEYIKLEEAVTKFVEINSRSFDTTQIVYLLDMLPKYEMPNCNNCTYKSEAKYSTETWEEFKG